MLKITMTKIQLVLQKDILRKWFSDILIPRTFYGKQWYNNKDILRKWRSDIICCNIVLIHVFLYIVHSMNFISLWSKYLILQKFKIFYFYIQSKAGKAFGHMQGKPEHSQNGFCVYVRKAQRLKIWNECKYLRINFLALTFD